METPAASGGSEQRHMSDSPIHRRIERSSAIAIAATAVGLLAAAGALYSMYARLGLVFVGAHAGLAAFAVFLLIANGTSAPLETLADSARRVADGDLDVRLDLGTRPDLVELSDAFNSMASALQRHTEDLTHKIDELSTLYDMSRALGSTLDLEALLESTLDAALRSFSVDSGYVVLRDVASGELMLRARRGTKDAEPDDRAVRSSMSEWVVAQGRPLIFNPPLSNGDSENIDSITGALAAVCVPLHTSDGVIGAITVGSRDRSVRFTGEDVRLLSTIANHLTVAIGNTELFASLQDAYLATVRSLAAAVDAKEPHMRGHSERVAFYACATAERLGLSHEQRTALEMAAYLHDIGKIGISEDILRKPGPLDEDEIATMRHHPLIGANILRPVAFPWPISPVVRHHHERFDGTGYPAGLRGEEIPLLARVLSVTDAYEAMIADRPYRCSLSAEDAVRELRRCAGTHFDPRVVDALIGVLTETDAAAGGPERAGTGVDTYEARAVFVAVADGMLAAFRRLGGPRLTSNLESGVSVWLVAEQPAFSVSAGHVSVAWNRLGDAHEQLIAMRDVVARIGDDMSSLTGRSLVDHFYGEAVDGLTERLRRSASEIGLYRRA
jgi:putative nucleotidyltransferase with HDIG domain